jgi:AcrR family transcriptional regulator
VSAVAPRWTRLEHDERRSQILSVARALFSERRYSAVSAEEIGKAAGVTRGLLNHYFGTKRNLYLEVVRGVMGPPVAPIAPRAEGRSIADVVADSVDRWLDTVEHNRETWFAFVGAEGFGRDEELERIVDQSRDATVDLIIDVLGLSALDGGDELRAVLRTYSGLAQVASVEWLQRGSLNRAQAHTLLSEVLKALIVDVVPQVTAAGGGGPGPSVESAVDADHAGQQGLDVGAQATLPGVRV